MPARTWRSTSVAYRSRSTPPSAPNGVTLMVTTDPHAARTFATDTAHSFVKTPLSRAGTEGRGDLPRRPHHHRRQPGDLRAGHVEAQPGHAHRADRLAAMVEHHRADAPDPGHVLLVVQRPATRPDAGQVGQQRLGAGERVRHPAGQPGTGGDPAYLVVGQRGEDRLADRRTVQRK